MVNLFLKYYMQFQNLLASGCSFTADGIGGVPPTLKSPGGCSFIDDPEYPAAPCRSWASFLSRWLNVTSFANFAASGHGLVLTCNTIIDAIEKFNYNPRDTLVIFNVTSLDRLDLKINWGTHKSSADIPWNSTLLDYTFAKIRGPLWKEEFTKLSLDEINQKSYDALETLFVYLKQNDFKFIFTMMKNYLDNDLIQQHKENLVTFDPGPSMYDFCKSKNLLLDDNFHPNTDGHKQIAQQVYKFIKIAFNQN